MEEDIIIKYAKDLVNITIRRHKEESLGKEKMSIFLKKNINKKISNEDYDTILHLYNRYLAVEGYEIVNNINYFDIIDYNSEEYNNYCDNLSKDYSKN